MCQDVFGPKHVAILSNSAGSKDDITKKLIFPEAKQIESDLGLTVI